MSQSFNRAATTYDKVSDIQQSVFQLLLDKAQHLTPQTIVDLGCGTGKLTATLCDAFPHAAVTAIDKAFDMTKHAALHYPRPNCTYRNTDIIQFEPDNQTDLVLSNAALHWCTPIDTTLKKIASYLSKNGTLIASVFGPNTYIELKNSLESVMKIPIKLSAQKMPNKHDYEYSLRSYFSEFSIEEHVFTQTYSSLLDLLKHIQESGTRGDGLPEKQIWTPQFIRDVDTEYRRQYNDIIATQHILTIEAKK